MPQTKLTDHDKASLKVVFRALDKDGSGAVTALEMLDCLRTVQAALELPDVEALMREVDLDHNGTINWDEFVLVMEKKLSQTTTEAEMFEILDHNGTGQLNPAELKQGLLRFGCDANDQAAQWHYPMTRRLC